MGEEDYKTTKAGLLGKQTPAAEAHEARRRGQARGDDADEEEGQDGPLRLPGPRDRGPGAPRQEARRRVHAEEKAKKAKTLVGAKVNKKFKGYRSASGTDDGVISVEDGMCVIAWEGGEEAMNEGRSRSVRLLVWARDRGLSARRT